MQAPQPRIAPETRVPSALEDPEATQQVQPLVDHIPCALHGAMLGRRVGAATTMATFMLETFWNRQARA